MKHLKQVSETLTKTPEKTFKNHCKHMQHEDETLSNIYMKLLKPLETNACNMHVHVTSIANIQIKHLQHTSGPNETFRTYS
jgi:hypothetical protein